MTAGAEKAESRWQWAAGRGNWQRGAAEGAESRGGGREAGDSALVAVWNCIPSDGNGGVQNTARGTSE